MMPSPTAIHAYGSIWEVETQQIQLKLPVKRFDQTPGLRLRKPRFVLVFFGVNRGVPLTSDYVRMQVRVLLSRHMQRTDGLVP